MSEDSSTELAVVITSCVITVVTLISQVLLHLQLRSACCSSTPINADDDNKEIDKRFKSILDDIIREQEERIKQRQHLQIV